MEVLFYEKLPSFQSYYYIYKEQSLQPNASLAIIDLSLKYQSSHSRINKQIILIIKPMFGYDHRNRFDMNQIQSNILMNQIRAEKKSYVSNNLPTFINSHRQNTGKRQFQQILRKPTLSPSAKENNYYNTYNQQRGKNMPKKTLLLVEERSRSGKRRFEDSCRKQTRREGEANRVERCNGVKRLDQSPTHQNRTTINLKWN